MRFLRKIISVVLLISLAISLSVSSFAEAAAIGGSSEMYTSLTEAFSSMNMLKKNRDTGYTAVIDDSAYLLDELELKVLLDNMGLVTAYANVGFITYPASGPMNNSAEDKAWSWGNLVFGSDQKYVIFIIDMKNRYLNICSSKKASDVLTSDKLSAIADQIYSYATNEDYLYCAQNTFALVLKEFEKAVQQKNEIADITGTWEVTDVSGSATDNLAATFSSIREAGGNLFMTFQNGIITMTVTHNGSSQSNEIDYVIKDGKMISEGSTLEIAMDGDTLILHEGENSMTLQRTVSE